MRKVISVIALFVLALLLTWLVCGAHQEAEAISAAKIALWAQETPNLHCYIAKSTPYFVCGDGGKTVLVRRELKPTKISGPYKHLSEFPPDPNFTGPWYPVPPLKGSPWHPSAKYYGKGDGKGGATQTVAAQQPQEQGKSPIKSDYRHVLTEPGKQGAQEKPTRNLTHLTNTTDIWCSDNPAAPLCLWASLDESNRRIATLEKKLDGASWNGDPYIMAINGLQNSVDALKAQNADLQRRVAALEKKP